MSPIRPSHFLPPPRAATNFAPTRVSFVNAPTQPTATVSKGAHFEVMVPAGYNLKEAAGARQLSSSTLVASPVPGRGGKQGIRKRREHRPRWPTDGDRRHELRPRLEVMNFSLCNQPAPSADATILISAQAWASTQRSVLGCVPWMVSR